MIQISKVSFSGARVYIGNEIEMSLGACEYDEQTGHIRLREYIVVPPPGTVMTMVPEKQYDPAEHATAADVKQVIGSKYYNYNQSPTMSALADLVAEQAREMTRDPPPAVPVNKQKRR